MAARKWARAVHQDPADRRESLGVHARKPIRVMPTRTDKVPNTSATAASASTDLNGAAVLDACRRSRARLTPIAAELARLRRHRGALRSRARFSPQARTREPDQFRHASWKRRTGIASLCSRTATIARLKSTSIRRPPRGKPFHYFAYGAAVTEVEVDGFTGEHRILRADLLEDVGDSVSPLIDRGQIEGGFVQGLGWLTLEELLWDAQGRVCHRGRVHLQTAVVARNAGDLSMSHFSNGQRNRASSSAAKPSASRR